MNHKQALEAVIAAWDAPSHYGDYDSLVERLGPAVEAARNAADDFHAVWFINFQSEREFCGAFSSRALAEAHAAKFPGETMEVEPMEIDNP